MGESRRAYRMLVEKPKGKITLARPRHRWDNNIKIDLQEVGWGMDRIDLAQKIDSCCECGNETPGSIKCGEFLVGFLRRTVLHGVR
jgi:hypothetical protein